MQFHIWKIMEILTIIQSFDLSGDYSLKLGVIGAPETFLVIDGKIVSHRV